MINLLILVGAVLMAGRLVRPLLRVAIALLVSVPSEPSSWWPWRSSCWSVCSRTGC